MQAETPGVVSWTAKPLIRLRNAARTPRAFLSRPSQADRRADDIAGTPPQHFVAGGRVNTDPTRLNGELVATQAGTAAAHEAYSALVAGSDRIHNDLLAR